MLESAMSVEMSKLVVFSMMEELFSVECDGPQLVPMAESSVDTLAFMYFFP